MNLYKLTWRDFKEIILREGKKKTKGEMYGTFQIRKMGEKGNK